ncbi:hypothetical protein ACQKCL_19000 [Stutzerimonas stutzeri]
MCKIKKLVQHDKDASDNSPNMGINLRWFLFIVIFLGQLGPILTAFNAWWDGKILTTEIINQASQGNFLLFTTALLASSSYFIIKEYINGTEIKNRAKKSRTLLYAAILGFTSAITAFKLIQNPVFSGCLQLIVHWLIYALSILTSINLWNIETEESAKAEVQKWGKNSEKITQLSSSSDSTSSGLKI